MPVVVAEEDIRRQFLDYTGDLIAIKSPATAADLMPPLEQAVAQYNAAAPELERFGKPWVTPEGAGMFVQPDTEDLLWLFIREAVVALEGAGLEAWIGPLRSADPPILAPHNSGFSVNACLTGSPFWDESGDPGGRHLFQRMWDTDPESLSEAISRAADWCHLDGGRTWLSSGLSGSEIARDQLESAMQRIAWSGEKFTVEATKGSALQRHATFYKNGYVTLDIGGTAKPDWSECVDELTAVLVDWREIIDWGFVLRHPAGETGLGLRSTHVMHNALWQPHEDKVRFFGYDQDPRRHRELVLDVYGVQILGPGHDVQEISGAWNVAPIGSGRTLVTAGQPAEWFASAPAMTTLLNARTSFGALVDPIWNPRQAR